MKDSGVDPEKIYGKEAIKDMKNKEQDEELKEKLKQKYK